MSIRLALLVLVVALVAWVATLARPWGGYAGMNHTTGTVAALADAALHGESPGAARGATFLGSLYAPPVPLAVATLRATGMSWRAALRWVSLLSALALLAAAFAAVYASGASATGASVALALLLASFPFTAASVAGRADLAAAAFSIGALAAWSLDREQRGWLTASLAALAWLTKLSALTVPLAMVLWSLSTQQGVPAVRFFVRFAAATALGVLVTLPWHGPAWYAGALGTLLTAPPNTTHPLRGPAELLRYFGSYAELCAAAALALGFLVGRETRDRPVRSFALAALGVTLVVMANRGSDHNHLLELSALAAVCAGMWCERISGRVAALPAALLTLAVLSASWRDFHAYGREAGGPAGRRAAVTAAVRAEPGPVFTEDPLVAIASGRRAAIADPATLRARAERGDARALRVVESFAEGRYALVVLEEDLERGAGKWYRDFHLGERAAAALRAQGAEEILGI